MKKSSLTILFVLLTINLAAQCTDSIPLCNKKYNEIAFLTTHNAFNSAQDDFSFPNQNYGITRQLVDGVRALMIDVYDVDGVPTMYHGKSILGTKPLSYNLNQIYEFLVHNPNEIVTIIFECYVSATVIEQALNASGLLPMAYRKKSGTAWPTVREMIETGKRLVIFTDKRDASSTQTWYHYVWSHAVETSFSVTNSSSFTSSFNRGSAANDLFILNHFVVSKTLGTGIRSEAAKVNASAFLSNRIETCQQETGKFPNFITVDFYDLGNCMQVVNKINGVAEKPAEPTNANNKPTQYPNPFAEKTTVIMPDSARAPFMWTLHTLTGECMQSSTQQWEHTFQIHRNELPKGMYMVHITDVDNKLYGIKIIVN